MMHDVASVWKFRHFLFALVRLDLRLRYRRSVLGTGWAFLHPVAMTGVFVLLFSNLLGADPRSYTTFLLLGMAVWGFFRECAITGCQALVSHESYIRQSPLPYALYPLRMVLGQAIHSALALGVAVLATAALKGTLAPLAVAWAVLPALALAVLAGWAVATLFAFANVYFRDVPHLLEIATQLLFFLTPIMYGPEKLVGQGLGWLVKLNPVNVFLELIRTPLVEGRLPDAHTYLVGISLTALLLTAASGTIAVLRKRIVFHL